MQSLGIGVLYSVLTLVVLLDGVALASYDSRQLEKLTSKYSFPLF